MSLIQEPSLPYTEHNVDKPTTICLIHGGFSTTKEWDKVVELLQDYHLLLPDLPEHGSAAALPIKFTTRKAADLIADLIRRHAKDGKAYVTGISLGGHVTIQLVSRHPDVVDEAAFVTGYCVWENASTSVIARAAWVEQRVGSVFSAFSSEKSTPVSFDLCQKIAGVITTEDWPKTWPARTILIAAGKNAPMTNIRDRTVNQVRLRDIGRESNELTAAYTNRIIPHPWNDTHPELFVDAMMAWLKKRPLPEGFIEL